jgi:hypothetical protein
MYKYMYILAQINSAYKYEAYNDVKSAYLYANRKNLNAWQPIKKPCKMQGFSSVAPPSGLEPETL